MRPTARNCEEPLLPAFSQMGEVDHTAPARSCLTPPPAGRGRCAGAGRRGGPALFLPALSTQSL